MGGAVCPPCCFTYEQTVVGVMKTMATSFKRSGACTAALSAPDPAAGPAGPRLCWSLLDTHRQVWVSLLWGSLPFSPGSWCAPGFVCALQESVPPVLCKLYNQIPLASKVKFPGDSQSLLQIPRLISLLWVLELS